MIGTVRVLRATGWVSATIFLGAIGSGLWERLLRPFTDRCAHAFLSAIARIFHGYVDVLHRNIGQAYPDSLSALPYFLIQGFIILGPVAIASIVLLINLFERHAIRKDDEDEETWKRRGQRRVRGLLSFCILVALLNTAVYGTIALEELYARRACNYIERSIDILAPELTAQELLRLRAEYRAVDSAEAFYALHHHLRALSDAKGTAIPYFDPIK